VSPSRARARVAEVPGLALGAPAFYLYPETLDDALVDCSRTTRTWCRTSTCRCSTRPTACCAACAAGTAARPARVVERLRKAMPGLVFRTAFIVGHPGETDEEFQELCDFVKWAEFDRVGVFRYSDEESAELVPLEGKVPARTAARATASS
jgi:ribosomal protein S12 methylthiotransferase